MLLVELQNTYLWLGVLALILVVLLVLTTSLDYPLLMCWPAFSSCILLCTCAIALYQGVSGVGAFPITHSALELWGMAFVAGFAMMWVVIRTRFLNENI